MKKYISLLICVILCFMFACSPYKDVINSASKDKEIIDSGTYYRIYKGDRTRYCYDVYDSKGNVALSDATDQPLKIHVLNDNIVDIEIGMGTGVATHKYYDIEENIVSQEFQYVLSYSNRLIAYIDVPKENSFINRKVIVQNIFDETLFFKKFQLNLSHIDTPVIDAIFINDATELQLIYLSGEEQRQISTTLNLR